MTTVPEWVARDQFARYPDDPESLRSALTEWAELDRRLDYAEAEEAMLLGIFADQLRAWGRNPWVHLTVGQMTLVERARREGWLRA